MSHDLRTTPIEALKEAMAEGLETITEFIKDNPDVYQRGPIEFLTPRLTPENTLAMRKELATMPPEQFLTALDQIAEATSVDEAAKVLGGR